jgi:peptidoglycan-associated lipoprotein
MKTQIKTWLMLACVAVLAGCANSVSLKDSDVTDAKAVPVQDAGASGKSVDAPAPVVPADPGAATAGQGPQNIAKLVYFDYDSFVIKPESQSLIEAHARHLTRYKSVKVVIEGHTDDRGGREYNLALGHKRAEAVRKSLALLGVSESQMESVSLGKEKPAEPGDSESAMAKNRRAVFSYR